MGWRKSHVVYIDTRWLFLKIVSAVLLMAALAAYWKWTCVTLIEFESTDLASSWRISDPAIIGQISKGIKQAIPAKGHSPGTGSIAMRLTSRRETREYRFSEPGFVFDQKKRHAAQNPGIPKRHFTKCCRRIAQTESLW